MSAYKARPVLHIRDKSGSGKTPYALTFTDVVGKYGKDLKKRQVCYFNSKTLKYS